MLHNFFFFNVYAPVNKLECLSLPWQIDSANILVGDKHGSLLCLHDDDSLITQMRLHHSPEGSTYPGYKWMCFGYISHCFREEQNALAFNQGPML
jgi:hypothetical protein